MDNGSSANDENLTAQATGLQGQLRELREEHADLDQTIAHLSLNPPEDNLLVRRLKKRKLLIKDRIMQIEHSLNLGPDEYA